MSCIEECKEKISKTFIDEIIKDVLFAYCNVKIVDNPVVKERLKKILIEEIERIVRVSIL